MFSRLRIAGFRGFSELHLEGLSRVNLLVGTNNCGKTSVLEAISILATPGSVSQLWSALSRRGETHEDSEGEVDLAHLFHGHEIPEAASFEISSSEGSGDKLVEVRIRERDTSKPIRIPRGARQTSLFPIDYVEDVRSIGPLALEMRWSDRGRTRDAQWPLTRRGGISVEFLDLEERRAGDGSFPVQFITTEGIVRDRVIELFEEIVLTDEEEMVLAALRTLDSTIERIAPVSTQLRRRPQSRRGGFAIKLAGHRVPIGSMGDGIWRILGVALALAKARGGVLLVDEIDTGLHYSVLTDMWRLVSATAERLNVQVFATTHSRDCYEALAAVARVEAADISLHRIERGRSSTVAFSAAEIAEAAARGLEVR